ncbi:MAG: hypothetical protein LBI03_00975 [Clostridiales bacterium]|jgi:putative component of toxin-antitoxin plasmid stabilization module|nr:hypothetical protein [Clostridiales bacterium]
MYEIETIDKFDAWLGSIKDGKTQKVIVKRIRNMSLGKVRSLGDGFRYKRRLCGLKEVRNA